MYIIYYSIKYKTYWKSTETLMASDNGCYESLQECLLDKDPFDTNYSRQYYLVNNTLYDNKLGLDAYQPILTLPTLDYVTIRKEHPELFI